MQTPHLLQRVLLDELKLSAFVEFDKLVEYLPKCVGMGGDICRLGTHHPLRVAKNAEPENDKVAEGAGHERGTMPGFYEQLVDLGLPWHFLVIDGVVDGERSGGVEVSIGRQHALDHQWHGGVQAIRIRSDVNQQRGFLSQLGDVPRQ